MLDLSVSREAALAALTELGSVVSQRMQRQDEDHAAELMSSIHWAEGVDDILEHQVAEWSERVEVANARAAEAEAEAEAEAAAVPGLCQELADVRTMLQAAHAAEASMRSQVDAARKELDMAITARDEAMSKVATAEERERAALERAVRAEAVLGALRGGKALSEVK